MPKMIISLDGAVIKEVQLTKERTTLGRRLYNDIVIKHLAVSGEHAVLQMVGHEVYIEDLSSTNGTYVNGKAVKKQLLQDRDMIEIGKYRIQYDKEAGRSGPASAEEQGFGAVPMDAAIRVLSGIAVGRELKLVKPVTSIGKPGVALATISRHADGFILAYVEGAVRPMLNGATVGNETVVLKNGDTIELAGTQMEFVEYSSAGKTMVQPGFQNTVKSAMP